MGLRYCLNIEQLLHVQTAQLGDDSHLLWASKPEFNRSIRPEPWSYENQRNTYCICAIDSWFEIVRRTEYITCLKVIAGVFSLSLKAPNSAAKTPLDTVDGQYG
jgi:hypothetical protein